MRPWPTPLLLLIWALCPMREARADDAATKDQARRVFGTGVEAVQKFQWAEALASFEESYALVPNAITSLNIGVSERALGRYVRASRSLERALAENEVAGGTVLSETSVADAKSYLQEMKRLLVRANVTVKPEGATLVIDGRPLTMFGGRYITGVETGTGSPAPAGKFEILLDPGNHVLVLSRKGFSDAVVNRTFVPGSSADLVLELDKLPATIKVTAEVAGSTVRVGTTDVGPVPVDVLRPAGTYPIVVSKDGFVPYETTLTVKPGEEAKIDAILPKKKLNVAEEWWFWASLAGAVGTAATITYFVARPEPEPVPFDGGNTGWVVGPAAIRF